MDAVGFVMIDITTSGDDARSEWLLAVEDGARGRYAGARSRLRPLRHCSNAAVASLAFSTEGSLLRQLGWHRAASALDGRALAAVGWAGTGCGTSEARADALVGLAADSLGTGRLGRGRMLLARCEEVIDSGAEDLTRASIRLRWVRAEIALGSGEFDEAIRHARDAAARSAECPSERHRVKYDLIVSASMHARGEHRGAVELLGTVTERCERYELVPLGWAAAMLASALGDGAASARAAGFATLIRHRGGIFRNE